MFGVNLSEVLLLVLVLLAVAVGLYGLVRLGVRHGHLDAERRRRSAAAGAPAVGDPAGRRATPLG